MPASQTRKVYLDVAGRLHSLYKELVKNPPIGYDFSLPVTTWDGASSAASKMEAIYFFQQRVLGRLVPVNLAKAYLERFKRRPRDAALTYATGHLVFRKEPWVVDLEFATQLAGYSISHFKRYKKTLERVLASSY
jgi:hypothetical protein